MLNTPSSSAEVKKELSYTSTHPMGPSRPVTGFPFSLRNPESLVRGQYYVPQETEVSII
jgi:hypothetical protein